MSCLFVPSRSPLWSPPNVSQSSTDIGRTQVSQSEATLVGFWLTLFGPQPAYFQSEIVERPGLDGTGKYASARAHEWPHWGLLGAARAGGTAWSTAVLREVYRKAPTTQPPPCSNTFWLSPPPATFHRRPTDANDFRKHATRIVNHYITAQQDLMHIPEVILRAELGQGCGVGVENGGGTHRAADRQGQHPLHPHARWPSIQRSSRENCRSRPMPNSWR